MDFLKRYGPWALITGASDGTGRAFAFELAVKGMPSILLARREPQLTALADEIRAATGVTCISASVDLAAPDALERIVDAVGPREVGLLISNAGADPNGARFFERPVSVWMELVQRNVMTLLRCCHHFGAAMRTRGRGGLLLVNSGACYSGGSFLTTYSATKGFMLNFAEGLWSELRPHGVDVLTLVLGMTDTPALRALMGQDILPLLQNLASPKEVAQLGLARLPHGPVHNVGSEDDQSGFAPMSPSVRRARVLAIDEASKRVFERKGNPT